MKNPASKLRISFGHLSDEQVRAIAVATIPAETASEQQQRSEEPVIGDRMPDGTIFAGVSPDTGKPMYTTPADASLTMDWKKAMDYVKKLDAHGYQDWRLPTQGELNVLFKDTSL